MSNPDIDAILASFAEKRISLGEAYSQLQRTGSYRQATELLKAMWQRDQHHEPLQ
jgi:hypothetical protein